ncbi:MAG: phosphate ABC transporter permease subunit PstC [Bacillota bacterium]|nr:phosphate ABC transporter permease subunit PstC [Bacillota bacterium]
MRSKFKTEYMGRTVVTVVGLMIIAITLLITVFLVQKGAQTFTVLKYSVSQFFTDTKWDPFMSADDPKGSVGALTFIIGSIYVSFLALLFATPFAVACAIFITEISPKYGKKMLQPAVEIFVGIPSVVYGWLGFSVLCPFIAKIFNMPFGGEGLLSAAIVLSVMIFPTITTVAIDSIRNVPSEYKQASYGLGATRLQMIWHTSLPAAKQGILTGIVLGLARAFGEALAVSMVIGNKITIPKNILSRTSTLTTIIANQMGSAPDGTGMADSIWSMGLLLFVISFLFILMIRIIGKEREDKGAEK